MRNGFNFPITLAGIVVNPDKEFLLLERFDSEDSSENEDSSEDEDNSEDNECFEIPSMDIRIGTNSENVDWKRRFKDMFWETTRMVVSQLDLDIRPLVVWDDNNGQARYVVCTGVVCSFRTLVQVDYDVHCGHRWASRKQIRSGVVSVTPVSDICIREMYADIPTLSDARAGDKSW